VVALSADAAEIEPLVDALLEFDRAPPALGITLRELGQPLRAHANVGDLVGEDEVDRALQDRIADLPGDVHELVEDVAREPLEAAVDSGDARRRVFGARAAPEDRRLGKLTGVTAEVLEQPQIDLDVARLVPCLARHVHRELPGRVRKVAHAPAGALHRLELADHDPVHTFLDRLATGQIRKRRKPLRNLDLGDLARAHPDEPFFPRELVVGNRTIHGGPPAE
jgi:hypothetical protein